MNFKRYVAAGALAVAATIGAAVPAQADEDSYLYNLANNSHADFTGPVSGYLTVGYLICMDLASGYGFRETVDRVFVGLKNFDYTASEEIVYIARDYLCEGNYRANSQVA